MTTYELYINAVLCDLDADETITLLYQSPIFSELDSIQSNRSYNISLPLTPNNIRAIGQSQRVDVRTNVPYKRLPAALYMNGVPLFTKGYAVVTDISETINVTLTWGNVDNFQPLFDNNLRDLTEEMEGLNAGHIDWNESSTILDANTEHEYPGVAFWGVNFGMGLSNPQYVHPSVQVSTILQAIERQHDITIDGKERLAYSPNLGPIVPLVGKNGDEVSGRSEITECSPNPKDVDGLTLLRGDTIFFNDHAEYIEGYYFNVKGATNISLSIDFHGETKDSYVWDSLNGSIDAYVCDANDYNSVLCNIPFSKSKGDFGSIKIDIDADVSFTLDEPLESGKIAIVIVKAKTGSWTIKNPYIMTLNAYPRSDMHFPSVFPSAPNLPDMSQGDFILALMNMNGLFAYADKDNPDMIRLISIDDITDKAKAGDIVDWSDKVILNDFNRVDMPDASEFTIDDLAQSNILDYDNDDDVDTNTHGIIKIDNENIEKETELVTLPFSASDNATKDGVSCALVPIYGQQGNGNVNYSECSPRILSVRGAIINGLVKVVGVFDPWMKFGGAEGIVESKYGSYRKVVSRVRLISVRVKLSAIDLYNLDYTKPIYISQFGQLFALYSVETGEEGVCDCQLLSLNYAKAYYLRLNGKNETYYETVDSRFHRINVPVRTNGNVAIKSSSDVWISASLSDDGNYINVLAQRNLGPSSRYGTVTIGIEEDDSLNLDVFITQLGVMPTTYYLYLDGQDANATVNDVPAAGNDSISVGVESNGLAYIVSKDSRLSAELVEQEDGTKCQIVVPKNSATSELTYDPVVIGVRESESVMKTITITQRRS